MMRQESIPADQALDLAGVDRFTLPVREVAKAELFYTDVLGGTVVARDTIETAATDQSSIRVRLCPKVDVVLVQQRYGWLPADSPNPHWAFTIPDAEVDRWVAHFDAWKVPSALVFREDYIVELGMPTRVELHVLDPA